MRQIQGIANRSFVSFTQDGTWQTVDLSSVLSVGAKFVELEIVFGTALSQNFSARPTGTSLLDNVWDGVYQPDSYTTLTMRVDASRQVDLKTPEPVGQVTVFVIGEWGGDGVVDLGVDYPLATGWTTGNTGTYREFDLTSIVGADAGNVEAVLFYAYIDGITQNLHKDADVRANGSTLVDYSPFQEFRQTRIAKVDDDNLVEVREDTSYTKGVPNTPQTGFVRFAGYIKRGNFNDGAGNFYAFDSIVDGSADGVRAGTWASYDVRSKTSAAVAAIYWQLKVIWDGPVVGGKLYAREIGSTNDERDLARANQAMFPLAVDANFEVEHYLINNPFLNFTIIRGWIDFIGTLPGQATTPDPFDTETGVDINHDLGWVADAGATSHDVYFGTDPTPDAGEFQGNQPGVTFALPELLPGTTYYWRIDEVNDVGTTTGIIWQFTTLALPGQATDPIPAHLAVGIGIDQILSWTAGTLAVTHDVYFGTNPSPGAPEFKGNQSGTSYDPGMLIQDTVYYWRIDEVNGSGKTTGNVWSFTVPIPGCVHSDGEVSSVIQSSAGIH